MASMTVQREIDATPRVVWGIVTDLERSPEVISAILSLERVGESSGFDVGTRWEETREIFGRETTETLEVASIDPGRSYTVTAIGLGVEYETVMSVEPWGDGSLLTMSLSGRATSFAAKIGALFGRFFRGSTRKMLQTDLDDIAAAAEAEAGST